MHLNDPTGKNVQPNQNRYEFSFEIKINAKLNIQETKMYIGKCLTQCCY